MRLAAKDNLNGVVGRRNWYNKRNHGDGFFVAASPPLQIHACCVRLYFRENRTMDDIEEKLRSAKWEYADQNPSVIHNLETRIAETGRKFGLISYSDLVNGVDFAYPNINNGQPFRISIYDWSGSDRRIVGDCLGYISMRSYIQARFMASCLVVARTESKPSDIFFDWMVDLEVIPDASEHSILAFWADQVKRAHSWYRYGKKR